MSAPKMVSSEIAHIAYEVSDLEYWREKLEAENIKVLNSQPITGCNRFEFRDTFGNRVEFMEPIT